MEHADEVQVRWQAQRCKAEAPNAEVVPRLPIGTPTEDVGHGTGTSVLGLEAGLHSFDQCARELGLDRRIVSDDLVAHLVTYQIGDGVIELIVAAGQEPAVDASRGATRDHIVLVSRRQHRGVGRVRHRRPYHPGDGAEAGECLLGSVRIEINFECLGDRLQKGTLRASDLAGPMVGTDLGDRRAELSDRILIVAQRAVPGPTVGNQVEPGHSFLGCLDQIETKIITNGEGKPTDLADRLLAAFQELAMFLDQPRSPQSAASLLVSGEDQPERPSGRRAGTSSRTHHAENHGVEVLHVHSASAPDAAVDHLAGERRHRPVVGVGGHHVEVPVYQQRRERRVDSLGLPVRHYGSAIGLGL